MSINRGERLLLLGLASSGGELQDFKKHLSSTILSVQTVNEFKSADLRSRNGEVRAMEKNNKGKIKVVTLRVESLSF